MSLCITCNKFYSNESGFCSVCQKEQVKNYDDHIAEFTKYMSKHNSDVTWSLASEEHMEVVRNELARNINTVEWYKLLNGLTQQFPTLLFTSDQVKSLTIPSDIHMNIISKNCIDSWELFDDREKPKMLTDLHKVFASMFDNTEFKELDLGECPICLETMNPTDTWGTMCCHNAVHDECIKKCNKCPLCRGAHYAGMDVSNDDDDNMYNFNPSGSSLLDLIMNYDLVLYPGHNIEDSEDIDSDEDYLRNSRELINMFFQTSSSIYTRHITHENSNNDAPPARYIPPRYIPPRFNLYNTRFLDEDSNEDTEDESQTINVGGNQVNTEEQLVQLTGRAIRTTSHTYLPRTYSGLRNFPMSNERDWFMSHITSDSAPQMDVVMAGIARPPPSLERMLPATHIEETVRQISEGRGRILTVNGMTRPEQIPSRQPSVRSILEDDIDNMMEEYSELTSRTIERYFRGDLSTEQSSSILRSVSNAVREILSHDTLSIYQRIIGRTIIGYIDEHFRLVERYTDIFVVIPEWQEEEINNTRLPVNTVQRRIRLGDIRKELSKKTIDRVIVNATDMNNRTHAHNFGDIHIEDDVVVTYLWRHAIKYGPLNRWNLMQKMYNHAHQEYHLSDTPIEDMIELQEE